MVKTFLGAIQEALLSCLYEFAFNQARQFTAVGKFLHKFVKRFLLRSAVFVTYRFKCAVVTRQTGTELILHRRLHVRFGNAVHCFFYDQIRRSHV